MHNIKKNLLEKLTSHSPSKTSKKRYLVPPKNEKKKEIPKSSHSSKNHNNCVERRIYQEIEYKLLEQMKLNKNLINRLKNLERPLMNSFDFIIDF